MGIVGGRHRCPAPLSRLRRCSSCGGGATATPRRARRRCDLVGRRRRRCGRERHAAATRRPARGLSSASRRRRRRWRRARRRALRRRSHRDGSCSRWRTSRARAPPLSRPRSTSSAGTAITPASGRQGAVDTNSSGAHAPRGAAPRRRPRSRCPLPPRLPHARRPLPPALVNREGIGRYTRELVRGFVEHAFELGADRRHERVHACRRSRKILSAWAHVHCRPSARRPWVRRNAPNGRDEAARDRLVGARSTGLGMPHPVSTPANGHSPGGQVADAHHRWRTWSTRTTWSRVSARARGSWRRQRLDLGCSCRVEFRGCGRRDEARPARCGEWVA